MAVKKINCNISIIYSFLFSLIFSITNINNKTTAAIAIYTAAELLIVFDRKPEEVTDEACFKIYGRHLNSNENLGAKLDEIPEEPAEKR